MEPTSVISAVSTGRKVAAAGKSVLSRTQREELLNSFGVETTEHSLLMLDMLIAAMLEHERERGKDPNWYHAITDETLPAAARLEAATAVRATFLTLLRNAHDPILGNKMLATATAGLAKLAYPEDLKARVLGIVPQLVPADIDLLLRYCTEGVQRTSLDEHGELLIHARYLLQEDHVLRFILDGELSTPLDSFSYAALKRHSLIQDVILPVPGPARKPSHVPLFGFPPSNHEAFRLEWRLPIFGVMVIEAFAGRSLKEICPKPTP